MIGRRRFGSRATTALTGAVCVAFVACASSGSSGGQGDPFAAGGKEGRATEVVTLDELIESGPAYTPFDFGPTILPGSWLPDLLSENLVPVLEKRGLPADTRALVWGLVAEDGTVPSSVLQTTSGNHEFDAVALVVAHGLRYAPARNGETAAPVWILINISMLLR